ncbi:hypothetical protein LY76DRAFT_589305 [Colletotrichum caudatum]|nr:hypothetical protein LY76DRAFT_589305 [Colletotrichum caudatum]
MLTHTSYSLLRALSGAYVSVSSRVITRTAKRWQPRTAARNGHDRMPPGRNRVGAGDAFDSSNSRLSAREVHQLGSRRRKKAGGRGGGRRACFWAVHSFFSLSHTLPSRSVPYVQVDWTDLTGLTKGRTPSRWVVISGKRFRLPPAVDGRAGTPTPGTSSNRPKIALLIFIRIF